jgi:hypothetical protein
MPNQSGSRDKIRRQVGPEPDSATRSCATYGSTIEVSHDDAQWPLGLGAYDPDMTDSADIELVDRRLTVVCAVALKPHARAKLAEMLGDVHVVDIREPVATADVLLVPSCGPQTVTKLKEAYPSARLIVVELEDWDRDIEFGGPVTRLRQAGADAYVTADSLEDLALQLTATESTEPRPLLDPASAHELEGATVDDLILERLEELRRQRLAPVERSPDANQ